MTDRRTMTRRRAMWVFLRYVAITWTTVLFAMLLVVYAASIYAGR